MTDRGHSDEQVDLARRRAAVSLGERAEDFVAARLVASGAEILARRFRARGGELDLVARRGGALRFVEVKARAGVEDGLDAITPGKQRRIASAARAWLDAHGPEADDVAFLVALVDCTVEPWTVQWIDDAFDAV